MANRRKEDDDDEYISSQQRRRMNTNNKKPTVNNHKKHHHRAAVVVDDPKETDILCGKGKAYISHSGSKKFRNVIESHRTKYYSATSKHSKMILTKEIYDIFCNSSIRFLKYNETLEGWQELTPLEARDKISHAIRFANNKDLEKTTRSNNNSISNSNNNNTSSSDCCCGSGNNSNSSRIMNHKKGNNNNCIINLMNGGSKFIKSDGNNIGFGCYLLELTKEEIPLYNYFFNRQKKILAAIKSSGCHNKDFNNSWIDDEYYRQPELLSLLPVPLPASPILPLAVSTMSSSSSLYHPTTTTLSSNNNNVDEDITMMSEEEECGGHDNDNDNEYNNNNIIPMNYNSIQEEQQQQQQQQQQPSSFPSSNTENMDYVWSSIPDR